MRAMVMRFCQVTLEVHVAQLGRTHVDKYIASNRRNGTQAELIALTIQVQSIVTFYKVDKKRARVS